MMCEQFILEKTGLTVEDHQRLTIERYSVLAGFAEVFVENISKQCGYNTSI